MGRAAFQTNVLARPVKPHDDAERRHSTAALRYNDMVGWRCDLAPGSQSGSEVEVKRNAATATFLGRTVTQVEQATELAVAVDHHVPGQVRNLASAQPCLGREQHDQGIAQRMAGAAGVDEQVFEV